MSGGSYLVRLQPFLAAGDDKRNPLSFGDGAPVLAFNIPEVNKYILTLVAGNEAVTLANIEPFDCAQLPV